MGVVIPPGYGQLLYRFSLAGDPEEMVCTMGVTLQDAGGAYQDVVDDLAADFTAQFGASSIGVGYTFNGTRLYVGQDGGPPTVFENNTAVVGTFASALLPQNVALLIKKRTNQAGRANQGRMYMPPFMVGESAVSELGVIGASSVTAINTKLEALRVDAAAGPLSTDFVILHGPTVPATPTAVTTLTVDPKVATQRQRLRR